MDEPEAAHAPNFRLLIIPNRLPIFRPVGTDGAAPPELFVAFAANGSYENECFRGYIGFGTSGHVASELQMGFQSTQDADFPPFSRSSQDSPARMRLEAA